MHSSPLREITDDEVAAFREQGVAYLPQVFDGTWIETLRRGLAKNREQPTARSRIWDRDADGRTVFYDSQAWQNIDEYRQFVCDSPAVEIAASLLQASRVNFFFDAVFVRSPGTQFRTPWHQDEPYWSVDGFDTCGIWMPLVPVAAENALAFVPGSHVGDKPLIQPNFGDLNPDGQEDVHHVDFAAVADEDFPDIDADPDTFGVTSWDMQPGDCVVLNGRMVHGGSGMLPADQGLEVFTTKWLGDDVRIKFRECGMDPDHTDVMTAAGLGPGDRPGGDLYPQLWPRAS